MIQLEAWCREASTLERQRDELIRQLQTRQIDLDTFYRLMKRFESGEEDSGFYFLETKRDRRSGEIRSVEVTQPWLQAHSSLLRSFDGKYRELFSINMEFSEVRPEVSEEASSYLAVADYLSRIGDLSNLGARPKAYVGTGLATRRFPEDEAEFNTYVRETIEEINAFVARWGPEAEQLKEVRMALRDPA